jgi:hypothetical protein
MGQAMQSSFILHAGSYGIGALMILIGGLSALGVHIPDVSVASPTTTMGAGVGIITATWKADQAKTAVKLLFIGIAASVLMTLSQQAFAADVAKPPLTVKAEPAPITCTLTSCTVVYGGVFAGGLADNLNILGNGVNGSINAGGMLPGADIGAQYYDGKFLFGAEADIGYQFNSNASVNGVGGNQSGFFGIVQVKAGAGLGLLPTQTPLSVNLPLPIITPYVALGNLFQGHGGSGAVGGAGIEFQLPANPTLFLDTEYLNGGGPNTAGAAQAKNNNILIVKLHKTFSF